MSVVSAPKDFKVGIVGGGMCGLACAVGLVQRGISVQVFEAAPRFEEVGAGVGLGPNAIRALDGLGVLGAILRRAVPYDLGPSILFPQRTLALGYTGKKGCHTATKILNYVYRPVFLEALMPLIDPSITHFDKRCTSISTTDSGSHVLHFADGTTYEADLVIGADGIKSVTRDFVSGNVPPPLGFTGTVAYRGLVENEALERAGVKTDLTIKPICWVGKDKHMITFPIQGNRMINIVAFATNQQAQMKSTVISTPWVEPATHQELMDAYADWGDDTTIILSHLKNPGKWYIHGLHPPLESYVHQRVVLVGDAAHAMQPHLGAGVGQGFEDVFALCTLLGHPATTLSNLQVVLKIYNKVRPKRANMVLEWSIQMGKIYESFTGQATDAEDIVKRLSGMWEPVWHHDLTQEINNAIQQISRL
ncbi:salicylate hydroxylase [Infundibulicybe gibba]|nr:salicylate hydroxylase [Infundibulicybe gibba]